MQTWKLICGSVVSAAVYRSRQFVVTLAAGTREVLGIEERERLPQVEQQGREIYVSFSCVVCVYGATGGQVEERDGGPICSS